MLRALVILCLASPAASFQHFQQKLPNADRVPDPANDNYLWAGLGHLNAKGGGTRNVFGLDFEANNFKWDKELCEKDSDSDGRSNGEELGDPDCTWTPGDSPFRNVGLSHPGICEPLNAVKCQEINKDILFRSAEPFDCPATKEPGVKATDFRFPPTEVPAKVTNYFCMYFPLNIPEGTSEHLIAYEPIVNNTEVMHHSVAYGCRADQSAIMSNQSTGVPMPCDEMSECREPLFLWTVGLNGQCHPNSLGTLIGEGGFTGIWLEHHWNNPLAKSGLSDSSGLRLYHTPNKRASNAAYTVWGAITLELPPGKRNILQTGGCPAVCTEAFNEETIYISQIIPHMHYLGRAITVTINGKLVLEDRSYSYDSPKIYNFDPPLRMKRGDSMGVNCTFTTTSAKEMTFSGLGTYDEMCFAIPLVYPMDASIPTSCSAADDYSACGGVHGDMGDCDLQAFWTTTDWRRMYGTLAEKCDPEGLDCWDDCPDAIKRVGEMAPCLGGKMTRMVRGLLAYRNATDLVKYLVSCEKVVYDPKMKDPEHDDDGDDACKGAVCDVASSFGVQTGVVILSVISSLLQLR